MPEALATFDSALKALVSALAALFCSALSKIFATGFEIFLIPFSKAPPIAFLKLLLFTSFVSGDSFIIDLAVSVPGVPGNFIFLL